MEKIDFARMTNEAISALPTDALRELAEEQLNYWERPRVQVAEIKITDAVLRTPGTLTALEALVTLLRTAYVDRGPAFETDHSNAVTLNVWDADDELRRKLRRKRDELAKEMTETPETTDA